MNSPALSILIPVHNERERLKAALEMLSGVIDPATMEVIVIDNGSADEYLLELLQAGKTLPWLRVACLPTRGKGLAVQHGVALARGQLIYMADVDFSTPWAEVARFIQASAEAEIVIGSRELDRHLVTASPLRRLIGRVFHFLVRGLVPGIQDTQCGFKLFRAEAAWDLFPRLRVGGLAFDVELLYLAKMRGYRVRELPVEWRTNSESRVRLGFDSFQMLKDVLRIPALHRQAVSCSKKLT